jgi:hypothetical protein
MPRMAKRRRTENASNRAPFAPDKRKRPKANRLWTETDRTAGENVARKTAAILICGTRTFDDEDIAFENLKRLTRKYHVTHVFVGGDYDKDKICRHRGADKLGYEWALKKGNCPIGVVVKTCWADWRKNKKAAGPIRNSELVEELLAAPAKVKACIAFWDGKSPGTADTMRKCKRKGIPVKVIRFRS